MSGRQGLLWAAIFLSAGVFLYDELSPFGLPYLWAFPLALAVLLLLMSYVRKGKVLALLGGAIFLLALGMGRMEVADLVWSRQSSWAIGSDGTFQAIVMEEPLVQDGVEGYARYLVDLEEICYGDGTEKKLSGTAYFYDTAEKEMYRPGDRISMEGKLHPIRLYGNPGKIDLAGRYRSRRLLGRIYEAERAAPSFVEDSGAYRMERMATDMKKGLAASFAPYMDPTRLHLLMTLLFGGSYNEIPESVMTSFQTTGIIHILSVSGSHVALLFGFLYFLGKWLRLPKKIVIVFAVVVVLFYAALSGLVPPVIRAAVMGILSVGGVFLEREKATLNLLGAALLGMLLWDPFYLYDVSFQLSVGASAGILIFYRPLLSYLQKIYYLKNWIREGIALSTAAQVLTLPIVLYDFHAFPLFFIPANLFVTPFLEWVIIAGLLAAAVSLLFVPLAGGTLYVSDYLMWCGLRLNFYLSSLPKASIGTGGMSALASVLYYATVAGLYFRKKLWAKRRLAYGALAAWAALFLAVCISWWMTPSFRVYCPDLGADRGLVLVNGKQNILYYKASGVSSHTANWEWNSFLGYEGIFDADILIINAEDAKETVPLTMTIPIKEIWVTGNPSLLSPLWEKQNGERRVMKMAKLSVGNLIFETNGSTWRIEQGEKEIYLAGKKLMASSPKVHTLLLSGGSFQMLSEKEIASIAPDVVLYGGSRLVNAWEDMELFDFQNIPAVNLYTEGAQEVVFEGKWKLRR